MNVSFTSVLCPKSQISRQDLSHIKNNAALTDLQHFRQTISRHYLNKKIILHN